MRVLYNDYINHKEERTMKTIYFATRTLARNAKDELNGQFKDFGTDAPKGERWAVLVEDYIAAAYNEPQDLLDEWQEQNQHVDAVSTITRDEALQVLNRPGSIVGEQTLKTPNNKPVSVYWRRNVERTRMAHNLEKTM